MLLFHLSAAWGAYWSFFSCSRTASTFCHMNEDVLLHSFHPAVHSFSFMRLCFILPTVPTLSDQTIRNYHVESASLLPQHSSCTELAEHHERNKSNRTHTHMRARARHTDTVARGLVASALALSVTSPVTVVPMEAFLAIYKQSRSNSLPA